MEGKTQESTADLSVRLSFEFLVMTAARSGEVRFAGWSEIGWESATWTIPAARMKARREHRVPLSDRALEVLDEAKALYGKGNALVFPSPRQGKALSDMGHVELLRRLDIDAVPHGFRSSFRDWCIERTDTPWAVAEAALAHTVGNSTEAAYARSDLFERRRVLMEAWAGYLAGEETEAGERAWVSGRALRFRQAATIRYTVRSIPGEAPRNFPTPPTSAGRCIRCKGPARMRWTRETGQLGK